MKRRDNKAVEAVHDNTRPIQSSILASARDKRPLAVRNRIMTNRNPVIGIDPVAILLQRGQHLTVYCDQLREGLKQKAVKYGAGYFLAASPVLD